MKHRRACMQRELGISIVYDRAIGFDIDTPADADELFDVIDFTRDK